MPLCTQEYKWVPANCWGNLTNYWGVTCDGLASRPGGVEILLAASCYGNWDKLRPDEPVGSKGFTSATPNEVDRESVRRKSLSRSLRGQPHWADFMAKKVSDFFLV